MTLSGRTILVTGAARGLGLEIARACSQAGATLIMADILTAENEAQAKTLNATPFSLDLGDMASINALWQNITQEFGILDGLVNNGAIATNVGGMNFDDIDDALFEKVMRVNVMGLWGMMRAFKPLLIASKGAVVNIASDTALWGAPRLLAYTASKGAVMSMTRSLARELGEFKVSVCCVAPGILNTQSTQYVPQARHDFYEAGRAIKGEQSPQDITGTILHLLTPHARALTGQTLSVDAGFYMK
jgi:NAD(P)-dependent dehydrogenase (short-subunit alcohol dehydrogenase family)